MAARKPKLPEDVPFARADDLGGEADHEDLTLAMMNRRVRVRYLSTPEITRLGFLPDLLGYMKLVEQFSDAKTVDKVDLSQLAFEEKNYQAALAHLAVMNPDAGNDSVRCEDCSSEDTEVTHPPSLWTFAQTKKMHSNDLEQIGKVACRAQLMGFLRPFSKAETPPATPQPATTGELIPAES